MGSRDHSITCAVCGCQRGGLNNYKCDCDLPVTHILEAGHDAANSSTEPSLDDLDLDFEIKRMEREHVLTWLQELQCRRAAQRVDAARVRQVVRVALDLEVGAVPGSPEESFREAIANRAAAEFANPVSAGPRCLICNRIRLTSDGENYDAVCICGHLSATPVLSADKLAESHAAENERNRSTSIAPPPSVQEVVREAFCAFVETAGHPRCTAIADLVAAKLAGPAGLGSRPPRKEWDVKRHDRGDTREADGYESSDYVDGWNAALDATELTESVPDATPRSVACAWCGNRYRNAVPYDLDRGLQGSHCASDVVQEGRDWFVRGGYGSDEHDMHRYLFVANKPSAPADPVCDECISERLQAGDLRDTGLECDRRPADFGPRPFGTWGLVCQICRLVENEVTMRRLVEAACEEHDKAHPSDAPCKICAAIREYRKYQRWNGELGDGGEEYAEGCPEVAEQLRDAARRLGALSAFWERPRPEESSKTIEDPALVGAPGKALGGR